MSFKVKINIILICCLFLSGCISLPRFNVAKSQLWTAKICCKSFSEMPFLLLKPGDQIEVELNKNSLSYNFRTGKSFFIAFKLPLIMGKTVFSVKSFFGGDVFHPVVTILDSNYNVIDVVARPYITYRPPSWTERGQVSGKIRLSENTNARYLIIHTTDELIGSRISSRESGYTTFVGGSVNYVPGGTVSHSFTTVGYMKISLMNEVALDQ